MTAPSKKWRVAVSQLGSSDYRSQGSAYEAVRKLLDAGHRVTVRHWYDNQWRLFERLDPPPATEEPAP